LKSFVSTNFTTEARKLTLYIRKIFELSRKTIYSIVMKHLYRKTIVASIITSMISIAAFAQDKTTGKETKDDCPNSDAVVTTPAPVKLDEVIKSVLKLKQVQPDVAKEIPDIFDTTKIKTKMEQFYTLLFVINKFIPKEVGTDVVLDAEVVRDILTKAGVFSDRTVPGRITDIKITRYHSTEPKYSISFNQEATEVLLNKGVGFYLFRNGLCQHAQKLIFQKDFSVIVRMNSDKNIVATGFTGVDLFGKFGNRGVVSVDLNYVALRTVEFYKGTTNGKVTAYVSQEEFKKNDHNIFLRMITKYVPDKSVQPIDW